MKILCQASLLEEVTLVLFNEFYCMSEKEFKNARLKIQSAPTKSEFAYVLEFKPCTKRSRKFVNERLKQYLRPKNCFDDRLLKIIE